MVRTWSLRALGSTEMKIRSSRMRYVDFEPSLAVLMELSDRGCPPIPGSGLEKRGSRGDAT